MISLEDLRALRQEIQVLPQDRKKGVAAASDPLTYREESEFVYTDLLHRIDAFLAVLEPVVVQSGGHLETVINKLLKDARKIKDLADQYLAETGTKINRMQAVADSYVKARHVELDAKMQQLLAKESSLADERDTLSLEWVRLSDVNAQMRANNAEALARSIAEHQKAKEEFLQKREQHIQRTAEQLESEYSRKFTELQRKEGELSARIRS